MSGENGSNPAAESITGQSLRVGDKRSGRVSSHERRLSRGVKRSTDPSFPYNRRWCRDESSNLRRPGDIGPNLNTDKIERGGAVPRPGFRNVRRRGSYIVKTRGSAIVDRGFATNNAAPKRLHPANPARDWAVR